MICPELAEPAPLPVPAADWSRGTELHAANVATNSGYCEASCDARAHLSSFEKESH